MLFRVRDFFAKREILEVDCPALSASASIDTHIDVIQAEDRFLHTSPEYGMKRLLAQGSGDIFQLSHVFRKGELGTLHNPEFTMAEWYRVGVTFEEFIEETVDFVRLFLEDIPFTTLTYRDAFLHYLGCDYLRLETQQLAELAQARGIHFSGSLDKDGYLQLLMSSAIEPRLGQEKITVLTNYPASQAALAETKEIAGEPVAERFEIYFQGIELANGYHELKDPLEQRRRLDLANRERKALGKEELPLDIHFLAALESGLPDCCGVAAGFDRLLMLHLGKARLAEVLPLPWDLA